MKNQEILGLLVNSDKHFDWVMSLSGAASGKGKAVKIHMVSAGVALINFRGYALLTRMASLTICAASLAKWDPQKRFVVPDGTVIVPPKRLVTFFQVCGRYKKVNVLTFKVNIC